MLFLFYRGHLYSVQRVASVILFNQHWGLYVVSGFPRVVTFGVSQPFYEILQLFSSPMMSMITDRLDLILLIITNEVWWWLGIVFPMLDRFDVWG